MCSGGRIRGPQFSGKSPTLMACKRTPPKGTTNGKRRLTTSPTREKTSNLALWNLAKDSKPLYRLRKTENVSGRKSRTPFLKRSGKGQQTDPGGPAEKIYHQGRPSQLAQPARETKLKKDEGTQNKSPAQARRERFRRERQRSGSTLRQRERWGGGEFTEGALAGLGETGRPRGGKPPKKNKTEKKTVHHEQDLVANQRFPKVRKPALRKKWQLMRWGSEFAGVKAHVKPHEQEKRSDETRDPPRTTSRKKPHKNERGWCGKERYLRVVQRSRGNLPKKGCRNGVRVNRPETRKSGR